MGATRWGKNTKKGLEEYRRQCIRGGPQRGVPSTRKKQRPQLHQLNLSVVSSSENWRQRAEHMYKEHKHEADQKANWRAKGVTKVIVEGFKTMGALEGDTVVS